MAKQAAVARQPVKLTLSFCDEVVDQPQPFDDSC